MKKYQTDQLHANGQLKPSQHTSNIVAMHTCTLSIRKKKAYQSKQIYTVLYIPVSENLEQLCTPVFEIQLETSF